MSAPDGACEAVRNNAWEVHYGLGWTGWDLAMTKTQERKKADS